MKILFRTFVVLSLIAMVFFLGGIFADSFNDPKVPVQAAASVIALLLLPLAATLVFTKLFNRWTKGNTDDSQTP